MDEASLYEHILGISKPWFVEHIELIDGTVHVYVCCDDTLKLKCPACGKKCARYDAKPRTWRHLDTCQFQTIVHCDVPRTDCPEHGVLQVGVPWAQKQGRYTLMFENLVIDWLQELSINAVARRLNLSWNAVDRIMRDAVERGLRLRSEPDIRHLSVDEVSRKKGHKYVTVISNQQGQVVDVQSGKDKDSLGRFYQGMTEAQLAGIETISMDMSPAYIHATLEQIPEAKKKICFDKFHVIQDLNRAVDGVRKTEMTNIASDHRKSLHLSKYIWLRNEGSLTATHREIKTQLSKVAIKTARAWAILQYAKTLWNYSYPKSAEKAWMKWYSWATKSRLMPMKTAATSIKEKLWGIINAIVKGRTNAMAESINAKLKMIKTRAKGFRSEARYKVAIMFYQGGLDLKH